MYDSRVLERGCGLTATVLEGVHVEDKASEKPATPTSITACFNYRLNRQTPKSVCSPGLRSGSTAPYPYPYCRRTVGLGRLPTTAPRPKTDPRVQQESDITRHLWAVRWRGWFVTS